MGDRLDRFYKAGFVVYSIYADMTLEQGYNKIAKTELTGRLNMHSNKVREHLGFRTAPNYIAVNLETMKVIAVKGSDQSGSDLENMIEACNKLPSTKTPQP